MVGTLTCRPPLNSGEREKAFEIRHSVFVQEQNVPSSLEKDADDAHAFHILACLDGEPVGTARMVTRGESGKIGRVAVLSKARGKGVGKMLMKALEKHALSGGLRELCLDAQVQVVPFYENLGYTVCSGEFLDAGILHKKMILFLEPSSGGEGGHS
jgi:predicted GNAT family N-acyltransferase